MLVELRGARDAFRRAEGIERLVIEEDGSGGLPAYADDRLEQRCESGAEEPIEAKHLTGADAERDVVEHLDELWGTAIDLDFLFYRPEEMESWLTTAGLALDETLVREPNPVVEVETRRAYMFAHKPARSSAQPAVTR